MPAQSKVKVIWKGEDFKRALHFDMKKKMELCCRKIEADIKISISGPPNTVNYQSSMVGTRSGALRASITSNWTGGGIGITAGSKGKGARGDKHTGSRGDSYRGSGGSRGLTWYMVRYTSSGIRITPKKESG